MRVLILLIAALFSAGCSGKGKISEDSFLWLEEIKGAKATEWVNQQNDRTLREIAGTENFKKTKRAILDTYNSPTKLRRISFIGDEVMYIDTNEKNPKGILYAMTLEDAKAKSNKWRKLIDFDELSAKEDKYLVFTNVVCNPFNPKKCMIGLSHKGGDNHEYREFDLSTNQFVENGFYIPEGINQVAWHGKDSLIYNNTNGDTKLSSAGYSMAAKIMRRGQTHATAEEIFRLPEGNEVIPTSFYSNGKSYSFLEMWLTFDDEDLYFIKDDKPVSMKMPLRMEVAGVHAGELIFKLLQDWKFNNKEFKNGDLLGLNMQRFEKTGEQQIDLLFRPESNQVLNKVAITKSSLSLLVLEDVQTKVVVLEKGDEGKQWALRYVSNPSTGSVRFWSTSGHVNESIVMIRGFVNPTAMYFMDLETNKHSLWEKSPEEFNTDGLSHEYYFAEDKNGTKIPYQIVGPKNRDPNKRYPVLMYVYGGHGVARTAWYRSDIGIGWLEKGGIFVVANVRGGGEYGAPWHQAAMRDKKHQTVMDIATISNDMFKRKITDKKHLGVYGVSAGGFAACSMLASYPELINAAICKAPLTDMLRYTQLFAGKSWISEYGDPEDPKERAFWKKYSPFEIIGDKKEYPTPLLIAWKNDNRVHPGHARRMAAKMQSLKLDAYYYESPEGGHGSGTGAVESANIRALEYEYFWSQLGDNGQN